MDETAIARINYRLHVPIIVLLVTGYLLMPTLASKYYENIVISKLRNSTEVNGVFNFGGYSPLNKQMAPKNYLFVKVSMKGSETIEKYYEPGGHVTKATYRNGDWQRSDFRSYKEDYLFIGPAIGFILIGFAALSRTRRVVFKGKVSEYLWNENDYWKYPFAKTEKIALIYGLPLFLAGFFSGLLA